MHELSIYTVMATTLHATKCSTKTPVVFVNPVFIPEEKVTMCMHASGHHMCTYACTHTWACLSVGEHRSLNTQHHTPGRPNGTCAIALLSLFLPSQLRILIPVISSIPASTGNPNQHPWLTSLQTRKTHTPQDFNKDLKRLHSAQFVVCPFVVLTRPSHVLPLSSHCSDC